MILPPYMNPGFYIDDPEATILGTYCEMGVPAYGLKEMDGWTSVYCAPQILRSELLASLAEYATSTMRTTTSSTLTRTL